MSTGRTGEIRPFRPIKRYRRKTHPSHIFFVVVILTSFLSLMLSLSCFVSLISRLLCLKVSSCSVSHSALSRILTLLYLGFSFPVSGLDFSLSAPFLPLFWIGNWNRLKDSFSFFFFSFFSFSFSPSFSLLSVFSFWGLRPFGSCLFWICDSKTKEWVFFFF